MGKKVDARTAEQIIQDELDFAAQVAQAKTAALVQAACAYQAVFQNKTGIATSPPQEFLSRVQRILDDATQRFLDDPAGISGKALAAQMQYHGKAVPRNADRVWDDILDPSARTLLVCQWVAAVGKHLAEYVTQSLGEELDARIAQGRR